MLYSCDTRAPTPTSYLSKGGPLGQHSFSLPLPLPPVVPGTPLQVFLLGAGILAVGWGVRGVGRGPARCRGENRAECDC